MMLLLLFRFFFFLDIHHRPLSMSENLAKLAHKIDFSEENDDKKTDDTRNGLPVKEREENDTKEAAAFQNQQKPWESVKTKLR